MRKNTESVSDNTTEVYPDIQTDNDSDNESNYRFPVKPPEGFDSNLFVFVYLCSIFVLTVLLFTLMMYI